MTQKLDNTEERYEKLRRLNELRKNYGMLFYAPYPKQADFHAAGLKYRERLLMAGNKLGKTYSAGFEVAFHVTGMYPDDWTGYRCTKHNRWWVGSVTSELTRDGAQRILMGNVGMWGTGCIPKDLIIDIKRARGVADAVETVLVRHVDGEVSQITFKAYSDGRQAWQAEDLDGVWFDEEPPEDIYIEGITRTNNTCGPCFLTFTPLLGMSNVVMRFLSESHQDRHVTNMTIDDVYHYSPEQKRKVIDQYPAHEREARAMGTPMLGKGRIFPVAEEVIREWTLRYIPTHWKQIIGMDFGWDHPTAAVHITYDPDADCVHVCKEYREREQIPLIHSAAIRPWGQWIPVAWPHDGNQNDKGSGKQLSVAYRDLDLNMLSEHAQFPDKSISVEDGISDMLSRMQTSRLKVNENCSKWFEEFRMYHRKAVEGQGSKVVKERDDLMSATRYAIMMLRYAMPGVEAPTPRDKYALNNGYSHNDGRTWMSA